MSEVFTLESVVSYWDVDRDQVMTLSGVFKLLQEAAIKHADTHGLGARAMAAHGESWVLNRLAARIVRYPHYEEKLVVRTWSAGIRGFRGYRDLRIISGDELLVSASTLWLYVNLRTKSLVRVPPGLAEGFPTGQAEVFWPDLDRLRFVPPADVADPTVVSLRYSDFDGNAHLNNTSYLDCLQTALHRRGLPARPAGLEMQFIKEVSPATDTIRVALIANPDGRVNFTVQSGADLHAQGTVTI